MDARERLLASRELGKAKRSIATIRGFYLANAVLAGLVFVVTRDACLPPWMPWTAAAFLCLSLAGFFRVRSEPFLWTVVIASVWSLFLLARIALLDVAGPGFWLAVAWTLGCWTMVPSTRRMRDLMRAHPDLRIARRLRGS